MSAHWWSLLGNQNWGCSSYSQHSTSGNRDSIHSASNSSNCTPQCLSNKSNSSYPDPPFFYKCQSHNNFKFSNNTVLKWFYNNVIICSMDTILKWFQGKDFNFYWITIFEQGFQFSNFSVNNVFKWDWSKMFNCSLCLHVHTFSLMMSTKFQLFKVIILQGYTCGTRFSCSVALAFFKWLKSKAFNYFKLIAVTVMLNCLWEKIFFEKYKRSWTQQFDWLTDPIP